MSSITAKDFINIYANAATMQGYAYGILSCVRATGVGQPPGFLSPEQLALTTGLYSGISDLLHLGRKQIKYFSKINENFSQLDDARAEYKEKLKELARTKESDPNYETLTLEVQQSKNEYSESYKELRLYRLAHTITASALTYLTYIATNYAFNHAITYLPNAVHAFASSLPIAPIPLAIASIFITGFALQTYLARTAKKTESA